jgi:hypothetical protein
VKDIPTIETASLALAFVTPGLIALYVRSQLLHGRMPSAAEGLLGYFTISMVYHALTLPFLDRLLSSGPPLLDRTAWWLIVVVGGPAVFGGLLGLGAKFGVLRRVLGKIGIDLLHPMPTAWDYKFSKRETLFVIVHMKDGHRFFGRLGANGFVSSDSKDRDIYIDETFDLAEDNTWVSREDDGVLIFQSEIRAIEFFKGTEA